MIDQEQIQRILQQAKITSISDIVTFITTYVSKNALVHMQDLEERVNWLEKPRGMDRVMIQEVKALVEAMLDQRQEQFHKQIDRKCRENLCNSFEIPQNSRRSLNEIDFVNIMNMQKGTQSQQLRKTNSNVYPSMKVDSLTNQIRQLRDEIMNKPERKQLQQIKNTVFKVDKELVSKVTFQEAQRLILKFQRQIFMKLSQNKVYYQQIEQKVSQKINQEMQKVSSYLQDLFKAKSNNKLQKKIKQFGEDLNFIQTKLQKVERSTSQKHKVYLQNFENIQDMMSQLTENKNDLLVSQSNRQQNSLSHGFWIASPPTYKSSQIVWERELFNNDRSNLEFQSGKTGIRLISAGFYQIACSVYGGNGSLKKGPSIMCNSQAIGRLEMSNNSSENLPRWRFREYVHIRQNRSTFSIRFDCEENSSCVMLMVRKVPY